MLFIVIEHSLVLRGKINCAGYCRDDHRRAGKADQARHLFGVAEQPGRIEQVVPVVLPEQEVNASCGGSRC